VSITPGASEAIAQQSNSEFGAAKYPDIIQNVAEQANVLTDIAAKIRNSSQAEQILNIAVQEVRRAIGCDRAVIYSLQPSEQGKIVAESIANEYPATLGMTIFDPCFSARYIDKYQMGRVRAISNIYQAGMTSCYIENLEKIGVKASLVVPVLTAPNKIYGLLVVHQCGAPRSWKQSEIDLAIQVGMQIGYTLERLANINEYSKIQSQIAKINEWQQLIPAINKKLYSCRSRLEVLKTAAAQTQEILQCDRVVVYSLQGNSMGKIIAEVTQSALATILGRVIVDPCFDQGYSEQYRNGRVRATNNVYTAEISPCYLETLKKIGVKSNLVAPILFDNGVLLGLLVAHECFEFREWQTSEIDRIRQIAMQSGLALTSARIREKKVRLRNVTQVLTAAEISIQEAATAHKASLVSEEELSLIVGEMRSLTRLLEKETTESTQASPAETQRLLQIIARRLQGNVDRWEKVHQQVQPQQQQIAKILDSTLTSIDNCKF
jgi:GAF domain-containing protein